MRLAGRGVGRHTLKWAEHLLLAGCLSLCTSIAIFGSVSVIHEQQYVRLAESFLSGKLYFISIPEHWHDTAAHAGRYYWPLGPLPALLLIPLVLVFRLAGVNLYLGYLLLPLSLWTAWLCFRLADKCGRSREDSAWLTLAFCGASSYLSIVAIPMSWPFAHVVAIALVFLALHEWLGRRRWWLMGFLMGLAATTRIPAGLNVGLFIGAAFVCCEKKQKLKALALVSAGFVLPIIFLGAYNFARFHSVFETGYTYQPAAPGDFATASLANVIPHLRIFLFGLPAGSDRFPFVSTNPFGISVLLLSPWLLYLCSPRWNHFSYLALGNCAIVLLAVLAWRSTGQLQVGYRFLLDFLPIITFLLARDGFDGKDVPLGFKALTVLGFLSTLYFLQSFVGMLPQG